MLSDQRKRKGYKRRSKTAGEAVRGVLLAMPKQNTIIKDRLIDTAGLIGTEDPSVTFQHSILCQTSLPYRDPGGDVRRWQRQQGGAVLEVEAGRAMNPSKGTFVDIALPFGPKPRLILAHLNTGVR